MCFTRSRERFATRTAERCKSHRRPSTSVQWRGAPPALTLLLAGGGWGSLDYNGQQVDDGHYQIVDDHTVVIKQVTFH